MRVIVCGAGHVGQGIVEYLASEDIDVIVIDNDQLSLTRLQETADVQTVLGHSAHPPVLEAAGAQDADLLVAVTSSDEVNIVTCQVAHTLFQVPLKIAHLRGASYLEIPKNHLFGPNGIPIDVVISPEKEVARSILRALEVPGASELLRFSGRIQVLCTQCLPSSQLIGAPISHIAALFPNLELSVMGIVRNQNLIVPTLNDTFQANDYVYFASEDRYIPLAMAAFGHIATPLKSLLILGGGIVATYLARFLLKSMDGITIRIIEHNALRAKLTAQSLPGVLVLHGNALDISMLEETNIDEAQAIIAVTNDNEVNLLAGLMAKKLSHGRTISLINNPNYSSLVTPLGIDVVISPRNITVSSILQHIRSGNTRSAHTLIDALGEIIEVDVTDHSPISGEVVEHLNLPRYLIIGVIIRDNQAVFPTGKEVIQSGDKLILLVAQEALGHLDRFAATKPKFF